SHKYFPTVGDSRPSPSPAAALPYNRGQFPPADYHHLSLPHSMPIPGRDFACFPDEAAAPYLYTPRLRNAEIPALPAKTIHNRQFHAAFRHRNREPTSTPYKTE